MNFGQTNASSSAAEILSTLSSAAQRTREGRNNLAAVLEQIRDTIHAERTEKAEALAEIDRLNAELAALRAQSESAIRTLREDSSSALAALRAQNDAAIAALRDESDAAVAALREQNGALVAQNQVLTREVNMLAMAIQVANQEIHENDSMLSEAMAAVQQEIAVSYPVPARPAETGPRGGSVHVPQEAIGELERMLGDIARPRSLEAA